MSIYSKLEEEHLCNGNIIASKYVLSAAICFTLKAFQEKYIEVWAGGINLEDKSSFTMVNVESITKHEAVQPAGNIAILKVNLYIYTCVRDKF